MSGPNQIVSDPRRFSASLPVGQFSVLHAGLSGLLIHPGYHADFTR